MHDLPTVSVPDGWLYAVIEIDIDSFVRAGVTQFLGEPHLFVSECLDIDQWDRLQSSGEMFYLAPIPVEAAHTFLGEHRQLDPHRSRGDYFQACERSWQHWLVFKERWLNTATNIAYVRRDLWQGFDEQAPPEFDPNAGWRLQSFIPSAIMHARLAQLIELRRQYYGDDCEGLDESDDVAF